MEVDGWVDGWMILESCRVASGHRRPYLTTCGIDEAAGALSAVSSHVSFAFLSATAASPFSTATAGVPKLLGV